MGQKKTMEDEQKFIFTAHNFLILKNVLNALKGTP